MSTKISQSEIESLVRKEETLKDLRMRARELEAGISNMKLDFMNRLDDGCKVEKGRYVPTVEEKDGRVSPAWKSLYLTHQETEHGIAPEFAEAEARKLYPAEKERVLVVRINDRS